MKVIIDADLCTGCGLCVDSCPNVFEMQDAVAAVIALEIAASDEECVKQTASDCPVEAIKVG